MEPGARGGKSKNQTTRRGRGASARFWQAKVAVNKPGNPPRLFSHHTTRTADVMLVALVQYPHLGSQQLADICGLHKSNALATVDGLARRGMVCRAKAEAGRYAFSLDERHAGAEHLRRYLEHVAKHQALPAPDGPIPRPRSRPPAFPARPSPLFWERSRTEMVLALALAPRLRNRDLRSICAATTNPSTYNHILSAWRIQRVIAPVPARADPDFGYALLNPEFPAMEHLRRFFAATATAYEKRLVMKLRTVLF